MFHELDCWKHHPACAVALLEWFADHDADTFAWAVEAAAQRVAPRPASDVAVSR